MLKLPSNVFTHTMVFLQPKEILASKSVSKHFHEEINRRSLWKKVQRLNFPTVPDYGNHEDVVCQLIKPPQEVSQPPSLEKFEFVVDFLFEGRIFSSHRWQKGVKPFNDKILNTGKISELDFRTWNQ